ncbi:hypothetical protein ACFS7Z_08635 [Pontibacter toksunensis]|uniref:Uncharacterized protein n=1 Tax=Pontibacter toksunensis TaxID=1332631 RepID=A0ABW6BTU8_9BACT
MTIEVQELRKMEAALQRPVTINSINDFIRLVQRYKEYLVHFNNLGIAYAKTYYCVNHKVTTVDGLYIELYLDDRTDEIVFNNKSILAVDIEEYLSLQPEVLRAIFNEFDYCRLTASFVTPLTISESTKDQLPVQLFNRDDLFFADDVLKELEDIKKEKLGSLIADL